MTKFKTESMENNPILENAFKYHPPSEDQQKLYVQLRETGKDLAYMMKNFCGDNRECSLAITKLEEAIMWANASIARNFKKE